MAANLVKLISSDNKTIYVDVAVAMESKMVKEIIETKGINEPIPLPQVSGDTLAKVVEYCKYHVQNKPATEDEIKAWDAGFVDFAITDSYEIKAWDVRSMKVDDETLRHLIRAAKDLKIKNLLKLTTQTLIDNIRQEDMLKMLSIENVKDVKHREC